jgi:ankyrin repeat protein
MDRNGASALLWAAGCGHLKIVRFLVETCGCDANQAQLGKRSFAGRTTLHWAARNGHLEVVQYLVDVANVNLNASTVDGTTAFCWACWQGHFSILR